MNDSIVRTHGLSGPRRLSLGRLGLSMLAGAMLLTCSQVVRADDASTWSLDPAHSRVGFTVRHLMISEVTGEFPKVTGTVHYDGKNLEKASVEAEIDATSIYTHAEKRDGHLRSGDFFDVAKFPTMTFKSTALHRGSGNAFTMAGNLTLHGVTRPVTLRGRLEGPIKDPWGMTRMGASASTTINRQDFGMTWNKPLDSGGVMISDEVKITLDVEMTHK